MSTNGKSSSGTELLMHQGEVTQKPGFQKGHAKVGGRKKGGQNKITRDVKEAVLAAGEKHGSDDGVALLLLVVHVCLLWK